VSCKDLCIATEMSAAGSKYCWSLDMIFMVSLKVTETEIHDKTVKVLRCGEANLGVDLCVSVCSTIQALELQPENDIKGLHDLHAKHQGVSLIFHYVTPHERYFNSMNVPESSQGSPKEEGTMW
jgi:hypothetical protein